MAEKPKRWSRLAAALLIVTLAAGARPQSGVADTQASPWSIPTAIVTRLTHAALPSLTYTGDGTAHLVWESNRMLYYASRAPGGAWRNPVALAAGMAPSVIADPDGNLHAVFANEFMGNYDIFYVRWRNGAWSLPVNISRTSGYSGSPVLALASDRTLHAAWLDNTPGYWTIYHGTLEGQFWASEPVPYARGQAPSIAASPSGTIFLAWQDRVPGDPALAGAFDIFLSELVENKWSLPVNVSDTPDVESFGASITTSWDGVVHLIWVDQGQQVRYCYGRGWYWSLPQIAWAAPALRGARIASEYGSIMHIAWDQGDSLWATQAPARSVTWPKPNLVAQPIGALSDLTLAVMPGGGVAMGWVQTLNPGDVSLYESRQRSRLTARSWLPLVTR